MKVSILFEESTDDLGLGWTSTFSRDGVDSIEDLLYFFGRASICGGFEFDGLEARQDYRDYLTGEPMSRYYNSEF